MRKVLNLHLAIMFLAAIFVGQSPSVLAANSSAIDGRIKNSPQESDRISGFAILQSIDNEVLSTGYRLASNAGDLCSATGLPGFSVHMLGQYPRNDQDAARSFFGFSDFPSLAHILAVAPGSPVEQAGLRPGDALVELNGRELPAGKEGAFGSYVTLSEVLGRIEKAFADGPVLLTYARGKSHFTRTVIPARGCSTRFETQVSSTATARADGTYVVITTKMALDLVGSNKDAFAGVIAHELAHNILRHRVRLNAAGVRRGVLQQFGRNARLTRQTEDEADRLGVHLADRAGYNPEAMLTYWRKERGTLSNLLHNPTHSGADARIAIVEEELKRIANMKRAGLSPRPAFMAEERLPALE